MRSSSTLGGSKRLPPMYKPFLGASSSPRLTAVVRNTRSPQTIGDDQPRPGTSVFQATFSVADQRSGRFGPLATPRAPGPRNCGQCSGVWPENAPSMHIARTIAPSGNAIATERLALPIDHLSWYENSCHVMACTRAEEAGAQTCGNRPREASNLPAAAGLCPRACRRLFPARPSVQDSRRAGIRNPFRSTSCRRLARAVSARCSTGWTNTAQHQAWLELTESTGREP